MSNETRVSPLLPCAEGSFEDLVLHAFNPVMPRCPFCEERVLARTLLVKGTDGRPIGMLNYCGDEACREAATKVLTGS